MLWGFARTQEQEEYQTLFDAWYSRYIRSLSDILEYPSL